MKSLLLSLTTKLALFLVSVGLGMGSYWAVNVLQGAPGTVAASASLDRSSLLHASSIILDAEPHLLAQTESPVDVVSDALGTFLILQANGDVVRVAPELSGASSATTYARLADGSTDHRIGFGNLALHPNFLVKGATGCGRFYVVVAERAGARRADFRPEFGEGAEDHQDVVYEYTVEDPLLREFRGTRRELMRFSLTGRSNNVSGLAFDPSGFLYIGVGDGAGVAGGTGSASRNASSLANAYGKVLRIDPLGMNAANGQYGVPESNPFRLVTGALPELWAFGLRAPRNLSYDPFQRGLYIAERAGEAREKINLSLHGGEHFGWDLDRDRAKMNAASRARLAEIVTPPAVDLDLLSGAVAPTTGSLVYRGEQFPSLAGALLFAGHNGQLVAMRPGESGHGAARLAKVDLNGFGGARFSGLRTGARGELVFLCEDGQVIEMRKSASLGTGGSRERSMFCGIADRIDAGRAM